MAQHIIGFVSGGHAVESDADVESNARMTALLGVCLLVAFGIESVTVIDVRQMFTWHVFVGLFIVPLVCFKLATSWRPPATASGTTTEVPSRTVARVRRTRYCESALHYLSSPRSRCWARGLPRWPSGRNIRIRG